MSTSLMCTSMAIFRSGCYAKWHPVTSEITQKVRPIYDTYMFVVNTPLTRGYWTPLSMHVPVIKMLYTCFATVCLKKRKTHKRWKTQKSMSILYLFLFLSLCMSASLSVCLSLRHFLSVCLFVCLSLLLSYLYQEQTPLLSNYQLNKTFFFLFPSNKMKKTTS